MPSGRERKLVCWWKSLETYLYWKILKLKCIFEAQCFNFHKDYSIVHLHRQQRPSRNSSITQMWASRRLPAIHDAVLKQRAFTRSANHEKTVSSQPKIKEPQRGVAPQWSSESHSLSTTLNNQLGAADCATTDQTTGSKLRMSNPREWAFPHSRVPRSSRDIPEVPNIGSYRLYPIKNTIWNTLFFSESG